MVFRVRGWGSFWGPQTQMFGFWRMILRYKRVTLSSDYDSKNLGQTDRQPSEKSACTGHFIFLYQQINDHDEVRMHITKTLTEPLTNSNAQSKDIQLEVEI